MNEKKKKKGFVSFLLTVGFLALVAGAIGFGLPNFVDVPEEINILAEFCQGLFFRS